MYKVFLTDTVGRLKLLLGCLFVIMLIFSKYATSSCIILFILLAFYQVFFPDGKFDHNVTRGRLVGFFKQPAFWCLTLIFFITVLGFFNSSNVPDWLTRVRIRLPFIALPVVFYLLPWKKEEKDFISLFALIIIFLTSTGVIINYIINYENLVHTIQGGKPIPVPMEDHIRYAQLQSFILLSSVYWILTHPENSPLKKWVYFFTIALFIYLHVIAVRSGLLITYAGLLCFILLNLKKLRLRTILIIVLLLVSLPYVAYKTIPSLNKRIGYAFWEWGEYRRGVTTNNSDSGRWISFEIGWEYFKRSPLTGIGPGDLEDEMRKTYAEKYPKEEKRKQPHNQFLHVMAVSGIFGLVIFLSAFAISLYWAFRQNNQLLIVLIVATFSSFMVEAPLEIARGTALIAFFLSMWTIKCRIAESPNRGTAK